MRRAQLVLRGWLRQERQEPSAVVSLGSRMSVAESTVMGCGACTHPQTGGRADRQATGGRAGAWMEGWRDIWVSGSTVDGGMNKWVDG